MKIYIKDVHLLNHPKDNTITEFDFNTALSALNVCYVQTNIKLTKGVP